MDPNAGHPSNQGRGENQPGETEGRSDNHEESSGHGGGTGFEEGEDITYHTGDGKTWLEWVNHIKSTGRPDTLANVLVLLAEDIEKMIDRNGWDQPAILFEIHLEAYDSEKVQTLMAALRRGKAVGRRAVEIVRGPGNEMSQRELEAGDERLAELASEHPGEVFGQMLILVPVDLGEVHPAEALFGNTASEDAVGALLVTEVWGYGEESLKGLAPGAYPDFPPSEDPNRVEIRNLVALLKDGTMVLGARERGKTEPVFTPYTTAEGDKISLGGRLMEALRRYLGMATGEAKNPLREVAAAAYIAVHLERELDWAKEEGEVAEEAAARQALRQAWTENGHNPLTVGEELAALMGLERALVLVASGETEDWEQARQQALQGVDKFLATVATMPDGEELAKWVELHLTALRWYDGAGISRHLFDDVPPLRIMAVLVKELANAGKLEKGRAARILKTAREVGKYGWPENQGITWWE